MGIWWLASANPHFSGEGQQTPLVQSLVEIPGFLILIPNILTPLWLAASTGICLNAFNLLCMAGGEWIFKVFIGLPELFLWKKQDWVFQTQGLLNHEILLYSNKHTLLHWERLDL